MPSPSKRFRHTPVREYLDHTTPEWVADDAVFFISMNTLPRYENHLCHADRSAGIVASIKHREELGQWEILVIVLMHDHLHMLGRFFPPGRMRQIISDWKRYLSRYYRIPWQRDFFDHRIRNHASFEEKRDYIRMNPVVAGLVDTPEDWPYLWDWTNPSPQR